MYQKIAEGAYLRFDVRILGIHLRDNVAVDGQYTGQIVTG